jgi:RNA polymerase sigma-70 factor (ECF subfamily)
MSCHESTAIHDTPNRTLATERQRLVRLCGHISGDFSVAEDLAQETLLEAHLHADGLRNPAARQAWLSGIARNVCKRWARTRSRELARTLPQPGPGEAEPAEWPSVDFDLELELERAELATLLDRALALLPTETRLALIHRYVEEQPQALIAERLGLSQGALAMRLSRGKLALRRILATDLHEDAVAMGLSPGSIERWQPTRIWCSMCGIMRLNGHFDSLTGELMLRCPGCFPNYGLYQMRSEGGLALFTGVLGIKAAYRRVVEASGEYYDAAFAVGTAPCPSCGSSATVHRHLPEGVLPRQRESRGAHVRCSRCDTIVYSSLGGIIQGLPAVRAFCEEHSQVRSLPEREIAIDGRSALVSRIESVVGTASLDVVTDETSLATVQVYKNGAPVTKA